MTANEKLEKIQECRTALYEVVKIRSGAIHNMGSSFASALETVLGQLQLLEWRIIEDRIREGLKE